MYTTYSYVCPYYLRSHQTCPNIAPSPGSQIFSMYAQEKRGSLVSEVIHVQTWATKTTSIFKSNKLPELTEKNKGGITVNSSIHAFLDHSG